MPKAIITKGQKELVLAKLGSMKVREIALLAGVNEDAVYNIAHNAGKSAKFVKAKATKQSPEHVHQETPEEKLKRWLQYVRDNKNVLSPLQMALNLGISLDSVENLLRVAAGKPIETPLSQWAKRQLPSQKPREKGNYSNQYPSAIAKEYWEEMNELERHKPKKPPPADEE